MVGPGGGGGGGGSSLGSKTPSLNNRKIGVVLLKVGVFQGGKNLPCTFSALYNA